MARAGYGYVADSLRDGQWYFLCPLCPVPRTKTDDPELPALEWKGEAWVCPKCGTQVTEEDLATDKSYKEKDRGRRRKEAAHLEPAGSPRG